MCLFHHLTLSTQRRSGLTVLVIHVGKPRCRAIPAPVSGGLRVLPGSRAPEHRPISAVTPFPPAGCAQELVRATEQLPCGSAVRLCHHAPRVGIHAVEPGTGHSHPQGCMRVPGCSVMGQVCSAGLGGPRSLHLWQVPGSCCCRPRDPTSSPTEFPSSCSLLVLALGSGVFGGITVQATWGE